jgi:hypothetical protein
MAERDSLSNLLARNGVGPGESERDGGRNRDRGRGRSAPRLDDETKVRLLDASLGVVEALRALAGVAEDALRERRDALLGTEGSERSTAPETSSDADADADARGSGSNRRQQIPLTY